MKKTTLLLLLFVVSNLFAQQYATKSDARNGMISTSSVHQTQPVANSTRNSQAVIFSESFDSGLGAWTTVDADGDGNNWSPSPTSWSANAHSGSGFATSASWLNNPLTPDNWLISPSIDLTSTTGTIFMDWYVRAQDQTWPSEVYRVLVSTSGTATTDFTEVYSDETVQAHGPDGNEYWKRTLDISQFAGQTIHVAFEHHNCTDMFFLDLDDISIYQNTTVDIGVTDFVAPNNDSGCTMTSAEDVTIKVFNYGGSPITEFDASYTIDGGTPVSQHVTGVNIAPATSYDFTFAQKADLSTLGYYTIDANVTIANDADATNNDVSTKVTSGDANLTVEVQTDASGGQSWELVNSNGDTIAQHGAYQWNITETTTVCLIANDCYTFHWHSDSGTNNTVTLSYNGSQVNQTTATGDYDVYGVIGDNCSAVDVQLQALTYPGIAMVNDNVNITGVVKNVGTDAITSFDVVYSIDGTTSTTYNVSGINVATNGTYNFTHDVPYTATLGLHNVEVTISNVNNGTPAETNMADNVLQKKINVASQATQKIPLYEEFTSSTCAPCATFNSNSFNSAYLTSNVGHFTLIKYQMNWPAPGDVYYTDEGGVRRDYYGVNAVPALFLDGVDGDYPSNPANLQTDLDTAYGSPAYFGLAARYFIDPTTHAINVTVDVNPYLTGNYKLHCAVVEKTTTNNVGNNGETEFYNVMMKMVPNADGANVNLTADTPATYYLASTLHGTNVEDYTDLEVVVFLQDEGGKNVMQSAVATVASSKIENTLLDKVSIYPNPSNGTFQISNAQNMSLSIYTLTGQVVYNNDSLTNQQTINLNNLTNGVYLAKFTQGNKTAVKKIVVRK